MLRDDLKTEFDALLPGHATEAGTSRRTALKAALGVGYAATALPNPKIGPSHIPFSVSGRRVILVDDVISTGRTIRAALDALLPAYADLRVDLGEPGEDSDHLSFCDAGIPTIMYGPTGGDFHQCTEWVDISSLAPCAELVLGTALRFLAR